MPTNLDNGVHCTPYMGLLQRGNCLVFVEQESFLILLFAIRMLDL